ncbi:hypothetical protein F1880_009974 [Penicillium rolfsii]|nr:hypothetical protein F1880_009974 [Penicillium rolfsii]
MSVMTRLTNTGHGPLQVPGFGGIPLNFELPPENRFAHGLVDYRHSPRLTKREMAMLRLMQHITETPRWDCSILDPDEEQLNKWHREAVEGPEGFLISDLAWDWCISELRDKAKLWRITGHLLVFDSSSAVCQADVSGVSWEDFRRQVAHLGPQADQESPLVDPFLYPLVYARSPVLSQGGHVTLRELWCLTGQVDKEPPPHPFDQLGRRPIDLSRRVGYGGPESCYSNRFQWLPCEVEFLSEKSLDVQITSYVNNLNPKSHRNLYCHLEHLITSSIPSWNEILFQGNERGLRPSRILTYGCYIHNYLEDRQISCDINPMLHWSAPCETHEEWQERCEDARKYISGPEPPKWRQAGRWRHLPANLLDAIKPDQWEIPKFRVGKFPDPLHHERAPVQLQEQFRKDGLQVVIEISRVELTPDKPNYAGDAHFHTEGLRNDRIAATSLFVVEAKNITTPRITFDHEDKIHAIEFECKVPDTMGKVLDVGPFKIFEEKAPEALHTFGSLPPQEVVKLRLVDPHYRVCSTRNVPAQQHDWWASEARQTAGLDKRLPAELVQLVMEQTDWWPISRKEAERMREELRRDHERKRKAVTDCVGHHLVSFLLYDIHQARDATDASGVGYESP